MSTTATPKKQDRHEASPKAQHHDTGRAKAENRLGLKLVAPAVIMMLLVTAYPMVRAIYLSLFKYRLTAPDDREFVGVNNYLNVLTDSLWWTDVSNTVFIMVRDRLVELVIGFAFAMVMHRDRSSPEASSGRRSSSPTASSPSSRRSPGSSPSASTTASSTAGCRSSPMTSTGSASKWPAMFAIMRLGDLEDHALHVAAARWPGWPRSRRTPSRQPRSTARPGGSGCGR